MYNETQKKMYLKYCSNIYEPKTVNLIESILNSTEKSEIQHNKDVCEFNHIEVIDYLKGLNSTSRSRLQSTAVRLSRYYTWCKNVEHLTNNIIDPFDSRGISIIIDGIISKKDLISKWFTKEKFLKMLDDVLEVSNQFILYAHYCGVTVEEMRYLKMEDLNFSRNELQLINNRKILVDSLFKHLMIQTNEQIQYFEDGIEKYSKTKSYDYAKSEYVIRTCNKNMDGVVPRTFIYRRFKTIREQIGNDLINTPTIYINGLVNYIKEQYAKKDIDLKTAILTKVNNKKYKYDEETKQYIEEFGSKMTYRILRREIKDYLDFL